MPLASDRPMRFFRTAAIMVAVLTSTVVLPGCTAQQDDRAKRPVPEGSTSPSAGEPVVHEDPVRSADELLVGRWLMIEEKDADGRGGFFEQVRRLLEFSEDGSFRIENNYESWEGRWRIEGDHVVVHDQKQGDGVRELARGEPILIENLDGESLVMIENLPEIYLRDGPPRRVRNRYRRISESELGPMLGKSPSLGLPRPGAYRASMNYSSSKFPTMEISIGHSIEGRLEWTLGEDGSVEGCMAMVSESNFSESKYSSHDGKHHSRDETEHWLGGFQGSWAAEKETVSVVIDQTWMNTCTDRPSDATSRVSIELECTSIAANERLPVEALACRLVRGLEAHRQLSLNPADSERAGPYTLQEVPRSPIQVDRGRPWLLLGAGAGIHVESRDDRSAGKPKVSFSTPAKARVDRRYLPDEPTPGAP
jgi:hypothetical protein